MHTHVRHVRRYLDHAASSGAEPGSPLLHEAWAEGAIRVPPGALGGVLDLDRAPEVKMIRRKLGVLATVGRTDRLMMALARHRTATTPCSSTPASLTSKSPSPGGTSASCGGASRHGDQ